MSSIFNLKQKKNQIERDETKKKKNLNKIQNKEGSIKNRGSWLNFFSIIFFIQIILFLLFN